MADATSVPGTDHDLLIRIDAKLEGLTTDLKDFKNASIAQITDLYRTKATQTGLDEVKDDHEPRIRFLEKYGWMAVGALALMQTALFIFRRSGG